MCNLPSGTTAEQKLRGMPLKDHSFIPCPEPQNPVAFTYGLCWLHLCLPPPQLHSWKLLRPLLADPAHQFRGQPTMLSPQTGTGRLQYAIMSQALESRPEKWCIPPDRHLHPQGSRKLKHRPDTAGIEFKWQVQWKTKVLSSGQRNPSARDSQAERAKGGKECTRGAGSWQRQERPQNTVRNREGRDTWHNDTIHTAPRTRYLAPRRHYAMTTSPALW